ncbi:MAG: hypothetical protein KTR31_14480 [Myxococcales bacterium]|nr:hypothetical protein [Myxococcales bacterium]
MNEAPKRRDERTHPDRETDPLQRVVDRVKTDAQRDPQRYLRETEVPGGGE